MNKAVPSALAVHFIKGLASILKVDLSGQWDNWKRFLGGGYIWDKKVLCIGKDEIHVELTTSKSQKQRVYLWVFCFGQSSASQTSCACESPEELVKMQILTQWAWGAAFLTRSRVMLMCWYMLCIIRLEQRLCQSLEDQSKKLLPILLQQARRSSRECGTDNDIIRERYERTVLFYNCEINQITHLTIVRTRKEVLRTQSGWLPWK